MSLANQVAFIFFLPPAIFTLLQYFTTIPAMSSNALTMVVLFLPLSSLWASTSLRNSGPDQPSDLIANRRRKIFFGRFGLGSGGSNSVNEKMLDSPSSIDGTVISKESALPSPIKASHAHIYHDREAQDETFRGSAENV